MVGFINDSKRPTLDNPHPQLALDARLGVLDIAIEHLTGMHLTALVKWLFETKSRSFSGSGLFTQPTVRVPCGPVDQ